MDTKSEYKRKLHIFITVAVMIFIFMQSALPGPVSGAESNIIVRLLQNLLGIESELLPIFVRKAAHFTEYMILGICLAMNVQDRKAKQERRAEKEIQEKQGINPFIAAWLIGTLYAVTDEIHQYFVPERACAFLDICIDSAGVSIGVAIFILWLRASHNPC